MADGFKLSFNFEDATAQQLDLLDKKCRTAMDKAAKHHEQKAKALARRKTGAMAEGVTHKISRNPGVISMEFGGTDYKTNWHEFGTQKMSAKPFITPGFEGIEETFKAEANEAAKKVFE